jgi:hypothetical protein
MGFHGTRIRQVEKVLPQYLWIQKTYPAVLALSESHGMRTIKINSTAAHGTSKLLGHLYLEIKREPSKR